MFGLSPEVLGMLVGLGVGLISLVLLRGLAEHIEERAKTEDQHQSARLLRTVAVVDVFLFVVFGYFVGPMVFD